MNLDHQLKLNQRSKYKQKNEYCKERRGSQRRILKTVTAVCAPGIRLIFVENIRNVGKDFEEFEFYRLKFVCLFVWKTAIIW